MYLHLNVLGGVLLRLGSGCELPSDGNLVGSLFNRAPDVIGEMACQLDRSDHGRKNWKQLSVKLNVPRKDFLRFELWSDENPTKELFTFLCTSRPRMTVGELTAHLDALSLQIAKDVIVNSSRGLFFRVTSLHFLV